MLKAWIANCFSWGRKEADVDINTENSKSNSGSNENMQNVEALIVQFWRIFEIFFTLRFQPIQVKFVTWGNIKQRVT